MFRPFSWMLGICCLSAAVLITCTVLSDPPFAEYSKSHVAILCCIFASSSNLHLFRELVDGRAKMEERDRSKILYLVGMILPNVILVADRKLHLIWRWAFVSYQMVSGGQMLLHCSEMMFTPSKSLLILSMIMNAVGTLALFSSQLTESSMAQMCTLISFGLLMLIASFIPLGLATASMVIESRESRKDVHADDSTRKDHFETLWNSLTYFIYVGSFVAVFLSFEVSHRIGDAEVSIYFFIQMIPIFANAVHHTFISSGEHTAAAVAMAMKLNRAFVRYISHELRSYLNHMSADIYTLRHELNGGKTSAKGRVRVLGGMQDACDRAVGVLDDVLVFDKIRDGWLDKEKKWGLLDIKSLLQRAINEVAGQMRHSGVDIRLGIDLRNFATTSSDHVKLHGDGDELVQALRVLLEQAVRASPSGEHVHVRVYLVCDEDDDENELNNDNNDNDDDDANLNIYEGRRQGALNNALLLHDESTGSKVAVTRLGLVRFDVVDKGTGLSQENLEALFRNSSTVQSNVVLGGQGSGLALSIAKCFVENNFGRLCADSAGHGKGCTFSIVMPIFAIVDDTNHTGTGAQMESLAAQMASGSNVNFNFCFKSAKAALGRLRVLERRRRRSLRTIVPSPAAAAASSSTRSPIGVRGSRIIPSILAAPEQQQSAAALASITSPSPSPRHGFVSLDDEQEQALIAEAYEGLGADLIAIFAFSHMSRMLECIVSRDTKGTQIHVSKGVVGACFRSTQIMNVQSTPDHGGSHSDDVVEGQMRNILCAPILDSTGTAVGVIQALKKPQGKGHRFTKCDESILRAVALRCQAMRVIERHSRALKMTLSIQGFADGESLDMDESLDRSSTTDKDLRRALRFLVVDGDRCARNMLKHTLERRMGQDAEVACSLVAAVQKICEARTLLTPFDAIIIDKHTLQVGEDTRVEVSALVHAGFVGKLIGCADNVAESLDVFRAQGIFTALEKPIVASTVEKIIQDVAETSLMDISQKPHKVRGRREEGDTRGQGVDVDVQSESKEEGPVPIKGCREIFTHACQRKRVVAIGGSSTSRKLWWHMLSRQLGHHVQQPPNADTMLQEMMMVPQAGGTGVQNAIDAVIFLPCFEGNIAEVVMTMRCSGMVCPVVAMGEVESTCLRTNRLEALGVRVVGRWSQLPATEIASILEDLRPTQDHGGLVNHNKVISRSSSSAGDSVKSAKLANNLLMRPDASPLDGLSERPDRLASQCVLVADDAVSDRTILRRLLRNKGFDAIEAQSGPEAIQAFAINRDFDEEFHLIFIDCFAHTGTGTEMEMEMDGAHCCTKLRACGYRNTIVGMVGPQDRALIPAFLAAGVDQIVSKPVTDRQLQSLLAWVRSRRGEDLSAGAVTEPSPQLAVALSTTSLQSNEEIEGADGGPDFVHCFDESTRARAPEAAIAVPEAAIAVPKVSKSEQICEEASVPASRIRLRSILRGVDGDVGLGEKDVLNGCGPRSLVVDDMQSNRKVLVRLLERQGHLLYQADDGLKALEEYDKAEAEGRPFHFIFMDFVMPNLDGPGAVRELRRRRCRIPIIGVTGNMMREDIEEFKAAGANEVLGKPVKAGKLFDTVREMQLMAEKACD